MDNLFRGVKRASAAATLALLGGCMVPPVETASSDYVEPYREPVRDTVGVSGYRPAPQPAIIPVGGIDDYYWIDTAEGLAQAIGSAPPDFAFRFDGRDAYAWVSSAGEALIVEPSPQGVIQYYYAPRAAAPYLVRDVYESYAFEGPDFVASYDGEGQLRPGPRSLRAQDSADRLRERSWRRPTSGAGTARWQAAIRRRASSASASAARTAVGAAAGGRAGANVKSGARCGGAGLNGAATAMASVVSKTNSGGAPMRHSGSMAGGGAVGVGLPRWRGAVPWCPWFLRRPLPSHLRRAVAVAGPLLPRRR